MDIRQELLETERKAAQLREKLKKVEQLDKQKKELEDSVDEEKQRVVSARQQLEDKTNWAREKYTIRQSLQLRVNQLKTEQQEYNRKTDKAVSDLLYEVDGITKTVGQTLFDTFKVVWDIDNPVTDTPTNRSAYGTYNVDAIAERKRRERKLENDWKAFIIGVVQSV